MRTCVTLVCGQPRTGRSALVARLVAERPDWLGFVNAGADGGSRLHSLPAGCPCCTARVTMQVALVRVLRERRPVRVLIELPDETHRPALARTLRGWPLSQYVQVGRPLALPDDSGLTASELEALDPSE